MKVILLLTAATVLLCGASVSATTVHIVPGAGYAKDAYAALREAVVSEARAGVAAAATAAENGLHVCVAHSADGAERLLEAAAARSVGDQCEHGIVLLGAAPTSAQLRDVPQDVLVVHGSMDGVTRLSNFAVARHHALQERTTSPHGPARRFASIHGASHASFVDPHVEPSALAKAVDLRPALAHREAHAAVAKVVHNFLVTAITGQPGSGALAQAEADAESLSAPVVAALEMEGSTKLGKEACNSDFPTNPTCNYPKYPDHAFPPGPAPAPAPLPSADCICGSPWVEKIANPLIAGLGESKRPTATSFDADAFHDVSDVHPFHLPHIWNECPAGSSGPCTLNMTTVTMPIYKAGDLFPNASAAPLSAFEMRTKLKSRQAVWESAGLGPQDSGKTDKNMTMCRAVNELAYVWALQHADASVRARFEAEGEPFVMVDDKPASIGITGPQWIKDELVYTRKSGTSSSSSGSAAGSHIEIQSWQFVVGNTNNGKLPWLFPVGMHYCKFLSPARAMEWIYTDGLRAARGGL